MVMILIWNAEVHTCYMVSPFFSLWAHTVVFAIKNDLPLYLVGAALCENSLAWG
jgi:hypothetical protein